MAAPYIGNDNANTNFGSQENQYGIGGDDYLAPNNPNRLYYLYGGNGDNHLEGFNFDDEIYGGRDEDDLYGYDGWDYLDGGTGGDHLYGGYGNDTLSGGPGQDSFFFDTTLNSKQNFDKILDFISGSGGDLTLLSKSVFKGTGSIDNSLSSKKFEVGSDATSSKTRILYNENKGVVFYTPNGSDGGKTKFVKVTKGMELDSDDFFIIA